jgi:hypothetical protein
MNAAPPPDLAPADPAPAPARSLALRVLSALGMALGVLVLALATVFFGTYFWLASSPGRAQLAGLVRAAAPAVEVDLVAWGPDPGTVVLGPGRVRDGSGRELAALNGGSVQVAPLSVLSGDLTVLRLELELGRVAMHQGADGRVDLASALAPPRPVAVASGAPSKPREPIRIDAFRARIAELALDLQPAPSGIVLRDLEVEGRLTLGAPEALAVALDVRVGAFDAAWNKGRKVVGCDRIAARLRLGGDTLEVEHLDFFRTDARGVESAIVSVRGDIKGLGRAAPAIPTATFAVTLSLSPFDTHLFTGGALPFGMDLDGVALVVGPDVERGVRVAGSIGQAMAGRWTSGPFAMDELTLAGARFVATPGLLVPELEVAIDGISAARLSGVDWRLEGIDLTPLGATLEKRLDAFAHARVATWTLPTGVVGPAELALSTTLKLTGGTLDALARTSYGDIDARGLLRSSPFTKKTDFSATFALRNLTGPLRQAFIHDLDDAARARLLGDDGAAALSGEAELDLELEREAPDPEAADRADVWVATLEWLTGRLVGKTALAWDGYAWSDAPVEPPTPVRDAPEEP